MLHGVTTEKTEDGGSMDLRNVSILYHNTTRRHNPKDLDLTHRRNESPKTRSGISLLAERLPFSQEGFFTNTGTVIFFQSSLSLLRWWWHKGKK